MKKDVILIATCPSLNNHDKVRAVFENPNIHEVRFNTGVHSFMSIQDTVKYFKDLSSKYSKKVWIDIKGRQLRIIKWADPLYSCIELNHNIEVEYPAKIFFRNGDCVNITHIEGNKVLVDPLPKQALGAGQSVNIIAKNIAIDGYLTDTDKHYLQACRQEGLNDIMASFVESFDDLSQILRIVPNANIVSKIESLKGIEFVSENIISGLMAARDDLFIESGQNYSMLNLLKIIIERDPQAICASKIFTSLEKRDNVDFADYADLHLMYSLGYRRFMLCDNVCNYSLKKAIDAWEGFINA